MFKPISISLSPNVEKDDVALALKTIFSFNWKKGKAVFELESQFEKYLNVSDAFSFNSGRSAFWAILKSLDLPEKSEVLLQAFTCNAVPNPVIWSGLTPVFVDCKEDDFNIDLEDAAKKLTKNSRALVVQHAFGMPADMEEAVRFCQENNLILIEDCAHSLGAEYKGRKVGTFGQASFFSFSRDKIISSVYGGIAASNDPVLAGKIGEWQRKIGCPSYYWTFQQLLHPVLLNYFILPLYGFLDLGKIFLVFSQFTHILSKAVHWKEKQGRIPDYFPKALPNALAVLALHQFQKLERFNNHRAKIAEFYYSNLTNSSFKLPARFSERKSAFLRFTIIHRKAHEIICRMWDKENILIGDWYTSPVAPDDTKLEKIGYVKGTCPNAERLSKMAFNLPTHIGITEEIAKKILIKALDGV